MDVARDTKDHEVTYLHHATMVIVPFENLFLLTKMGQARSGSWPAAQVLIGDLWGRYY